MKSNYCSLWPDRLNIPGWITYDISGLCKIHDDRYDAGYPRALADREFYDGLCKAYPEYIKLWGIVYMAVRKVGWLFYITKKYSLFVGLQKMAANRIKSEITLRLNRYA